jgi:hypothetical protein
LRTSHGRRELRRVVVDLVLALIAIAALSLLTTAGAFAAVGQWVAQALGF